MTKVTVPVTQKDREAAASGYFAWCSANPVIPERMLVGSADDHSMIQAFARHRIAADLAGYERGQRETVARIVAWLRKCQKAKLNHHAEVCHREDDDVLDAIVTAMNTFAYAADAIEAEEWK